MNQDDSYEQEQSKEFSNIVLSLNYFLNCHDQLNAELQNNTKLRMKYPMDPNKFYKSEELINNIIQTLKNITHQNIRDLIKSNLLVPLIKTLSHPNLDICIATIQFLYQILQEQPTDDKLFEQYYRLIIWMGQNHVLEGLVQNLTKLQQQNNVQEYEVVNKILKILDIFNNTYDQNIQTLINETKILDYLANRILPNFVPKHKIIDDNKYVSSDLLIVILSYSQTAQKYFSNLSGMEILLQSISIYESKNPQNVDQSEYLSNLFSCLSVLLINYTLLQSKKIYHQMKGSYLMTSFIKKKNQFSILALKVMANSLNGIGIEQQKQILQNIINDGALKYIFAILMGKGIKGQDIDEQKSIIQNCLLIIYSLIRSSQGVFRDRVQNKLIQNRFQKLEKLFQLRNEYCQNVGKQVEVKSQQDTDYLNKLKDGLAIIQTIDKTILVLVQNFSNLLKNKVKNLMTIYGIKVNQIQKTVQQNYKYAGIKNQKTFIEQLLAKNIIILRQLCQKQEKNSE